MSTIIFDKLPTLDHYYQLLKYVHTYIENFGQLIEFNIEIIQLATIEEIENRMVAVGFTQCLIDKAIEDIKDYIFIIDGIPTNELTLQQLLDNIEVETDFITEHSRFGIGGVKSIITNFTCLVYNIFYIGSKPIHYLSSICPNVSCMTIYNGIPKNDDDNFRTLSVEKFELLLEILEYDWVVISKYNVLEFYKFKNKYIYEYWKNKNIDNFLEYILYRLENILTNYDLLYKQIFDSSANFFTQILEDNKNTQKLYNLLKKYQRGADSNHWNFQLCKRLKDYVNLEAINVNLEAINVNLEKENADLQEKIKELEAIIKV